MYAMVREFLERLGSGDELIEYSTGDKRIAMAVLLFRVVTADGKIRSNELKRYRQILEDELEIPPDEIDLFERVVRDESEAERSLFPFTAIVSKMPFETKRHILQLMRDLSVADSELHEFEINLVARTAELLGIGLDD
ncbi:MAG: TerB family tellurite resistance protein [Nitratireductor sp.]|nr:TerB family tellurite resistance protein [Nitratireductor sp.]